jgi:hypothetical protein
MAQNIKVTVECSYCGREAVFEGDRGAVYNQKEQFDREHLHGGRGSTTWVEEEV